MLAKEQHSPEKGKNQQHRPADRASHHILPHQASAIGRVLQNIRSGSNRRTCAEENGCPPARRSQSSNGSATTPHEELYARAIPRVSPFESRRARQMKGRSTKLSQ